MPGIFISYRRQDTLAEARAVYERLRGEFGHERVFIDLEGLDYGVDFVEQLERQLQDCQVLLALIGPHWLDLPDGRGGRRIDDENDFVRIELRTALARGVRVVPVLINGALMPRTVDLPADLHALLKRHAMELDFKRFDGDMGRLVGSLKRTAGAATLPATLAESRLPATAQPAIAITSAPVQPPPRHPAPHVAEPEPDPRPAAPALLQEAAPPETASANKPAPRQPRSRPKTVEATPKTADETDDGAAFAAEPAPAPAVPQPESWWQSAASKVASGAVVVVVLGYQAWHNGWWKPDLPAPPGVMAGQPSSSAVGPAAATVASTVRVGASVVVANTAPASTPTGAPSPARVASVAIGRPISINATVQQGLQSAPATRPAPEPAAPMAPFTRFRDCDSDVCPWMVVLPAGSFLMGSPESEPGRRENEGPQHRVRVAAFAAGQFEVTFEQWDACMHAGGCPPKPFDAGWGRGKRPVINVKWHEAQAYVRWLSSKTGKSYRLLSEAEWEYAARAGSTTPFAFGKQISTTQVNFDGHFTYNGSSEGEYRSKTLPVGSLSANAWQLHDMHGNVSEWVEDAFHDSYVDAPTDGSVWTSAATSVGHVQRGGAWTFDPQTARSAFRADGSLTIDVEGLRVARAL